MKIFKELNENEVSKPLVNISNEEFLLVINKELRARMQPGEITYAKPWVIEIGADQIARTMTMKEVAKKTVEMMERTKKEAHELNILFDYPLYNKLKAKCLSEEVAKYPTMNKSDLERIAKEKGISTKDKLKEDLIKDLTIWSL